SCLRMHRSGLLLLSLCAGSLVTNSGAFGNRRLCGIQLVEALLLVCGEKGLFYYGLTFLPQFCANSDRACSTLQGTARSTVAKRGIVEQCCHFYCDYYDLENYCNT
uniref:Insulin-like domain-containing protein n=1 Tax=Sinocyclocheilus rhinocerous TaxID=307959 RepID=A0A673NP59_9TELE